MPTARELLEQADALMRRNRKRGKVKHGGPPTLTDALGIDRKTLAPTIILPDTPPANADPIVLGPPGEVDPMPLDTLSDVPVLTDVVDVWPAQDVAAKGPGRASHAAPGALDAALEADALAAKGDALDARTFAGDADALDGRARAGSAEALDVRAPAVDAGVSEAVAPTDADAQSRASEATPVRLASRGVEVAPRVEAARPVAPTRDSTPMAEPAEAKAPVVTAPEDEFILDIPPPGAETFVAQHAGVRPQIVAEPPPVTRGSVDWNAMAEEIRMQVLQRLDLFTDAALREQLGARLRPIVDRASAELVETINQQLGELVRGYVAEAIEREIESWRKRE